MQDTGEGWRPEITTPVASLAGLKVIELPDNPAVRFCGRYFAALGADVQIIARPRAEPAAETVDELSLRLFVDRGKRPLALDLNDRDDLETLAGLCTGADVVIAGAIPEALRAAGVLTEGGCPANPRLILALLSDFGLDGPYKGFRGTPFLGQAAGGYLYVNGDPDREPLRGLEYLPYAQSALTGFLASMTALVERRRSGLGQRVGTSMMQTLAPLHEWTSVRYTHGDIIQRRLGNRYAVGYPIRVYPTKDGYFCITVVDEQRSNLLLALAGHASHVDDPRFASGTGRDQHAGEYDELVRPWFAGKTNAELIEEFQAIKLTGAPVLSFPEVLAEPHFREREFWEEVELPEGGRALVPGPPLRLLAETEAPPAAPFWENRPSPPGEERGPLAGLRVLDITTGWSGPHGLRMLGDLGADVVRVEAPWQRGTVRPDEQYVRATGFYMDNDAGERYWMTSGAYNKWAYNKRCVALRMNEPEGREVMRRLLRWADVVIENFSTQAWEKLGMTYDQVRSVNPGIIHVTMPGYGRWGSARYRVSYGNQIEAVIGAVSLMGYEGGEPQMFAIAWPDPCAGMHAVVSALLGLWERAKDGRGRFFEVSQAEGAMSFIGPEYVHYGLTGRQPPRMGNRHQRFAPHGVYPCRGEDRWLAIAVTGDEEWRALCAAMGRTDLAGERRLEHGDGRRAAAVEIDAAITAWSREQDCKEAMHCLQRAGVPAFAVYNARDMVEDEYLWSTSTFVKVDGEALPGFPYQLSRTPPRVYRPVPDVGEHNREVLREAGLSDDEIQRLERSDIIASKPTL